MPDTSPLTTPDSDKDCLTRYRDALVRIAIPGGDEVASQRSAEALRDIAEKALRPGG